MVQDLQIINGILMCAVSVAFLVLILKIMPKDDQDEQ